jgi:hypothetical protein
MSNLFAKIKISTIERKIKADFLIYDPQIQRAFKYDGSVRCVFRYSSSSRLPSLIQALAMGKKR